MPDPVARIRKKLERRSDPNCAGPNHIISPKFKIAGPPAWVAKRVHRNLQKLSLLVPPRVAAASFKCVWNDWCTARRFQQSNKSFGEQPEGCRCWFGCSDNAQDSIEHYACCPVAGEVLFKKLRIRLDPRRGLATLSLATREQDLDNDLLSLTALFTYAIYMTRNLHRNSPHIGNNMRSIRAKQALGQFIIQGCQGHARLSRLVDNRWDPEATVFNI